ncbi:hypothetical protein [Streptomyces sp. NPDC003832]
MPNDRHNATANALEHHLLVERFVNERWRSLPDIDLDVESERRLEVYYAIIKRFGTERTAVTGMPETYRVRSAASVTATDLPQCHLMSARTARTPLPCQRGDRRPSQPAAEML